MTKFKANKNTISETKFIVLIFNHKKAMNSNMLLF